MGRQLQVLILQYTTLTGYKVVQQRQFHKDGIWQWARAIVQKLATPHSTKRPASRSSARLEDEAQAAGVEGGGEGGPALAVHAKHGEPKGRILHVHLKLARGSDRLGAAAVATCTASKGANVLDTCPVFRQRPSCIWTLSGKQGHRKGAGEQHAASSLQTASSQPAGAHLPGGNLGRRTRAAPPTAVAR